MMGTHRGKVDKDGDYPPKPEGVPLVQVFQLEEINQKLDKILAIVSRIEMRQAQDLLGFVPREQELRSALETGEHR